MSQDILYIQLTFQTEQYMKKATLLVVMWRISGYLRVPIHANFISRILIKMKEKVKIQLSIIYVRPWRSANSCDPRAGLEL